ncbi:MAG: hypothetical protein V9G08_01990 [Dermatophilaceae bacterium]
MSGDGLVNGGMVPQIKPEMATQAAIGLRTMGTGVKTEVTDFNTDWKGLRAHYSAPEQDAVYTLQDPAQKSAESLATTLDKAAGHLDTFAGELSGLKSKFDSLTSEISNFRKQVAGGVEISSGFLGLSSEIVPWYEASETVTQNAHLVARVNELVAELSKAETTCATNIRALVQHANSCPMPFTSVTKDQLNAQQDLPWGNRREYEPKNCPESVGYGVSDFVCGIGSGVGSLVLGYDTTTGEYFQGDAYAQSWSGLGTLAGSLAATSVGGIALNASLHSAGVNNEFTQFMDRSPMVVAGAVAGLVNIDLTAKDPFEKWKKDPWRAGTSGVLNIATFFIPGAGEVAGGLKVGSAGARAAKISAAVADMAVPGGSYAVKAITSLIKFDGAGAVIDDIVKVGSKPSALGTAAGVTDAASNVSRPKLDPPGVSLPSAEDLGSIGTKAAGATPELGAGERVVTSTPDVPKAPTGAPEPVSVGAKPADPTHPSGSEPTRPTEPTSGTPTKPADPTHPSGTEPTGSTPTKPADPTHPSGSEPTGPTEPTGSTPTKPADPSGSEPTRPTEPTKPADPTHPSAAPGDTSAAPPHDPASAGTHPDATPTHPVDPAASGDVAPSGDHTPVNPDHPTTTPDPTHPDHPSVGLDDRGRPVPIDADGNRIQVDGKNVFYGKDDRLHYEGSGQEVRYRDYPAGVDAPSTRPLDHVAQYSDLTPVQATPDYGNGAANAYLEATTRNTADAAKINHLLEQLGLQRADVGGSKSDVMQTLADRASAAGDGARVEMLDALGRAVDDEAVSRAVRNSAAEASGMYASLDDFARGDITPLIGNAEGDLSPGRSSVDTMGVRETNGTWDVIFGEAKGRQGRSPLNLGEANMPDGTRAQQGTTAYLSHELQVDPRVVQRLTVYADTHPGFAEAWNAGRVGVEYRLVVAGPDGSVRIANFVLDRSVLTLPKIPR